MKDVIVIIMSEMSDVPTRSANDIVQKIIAKRDSNAFNDSNHLVSDPKKRHHIRTCARACETDLEEPHARTLFFVKQTVWMLKSFKFLPRKHVSCL